MNRVSAAKEVARILLVPVERISIEGDKRKGFWTFYAWFDEGMNGYRFGHGMEHKQSDALLELCHSVATKRLSLSSDIYKWYLEPERADKRLLDV